MNRNWVSKDGRHDKILDCSKLKAFPEDKKRHSTKIEIGFENGRQHCGKSRKCWLPAFSAFATQYSKGFFLIVIKTLHNVVKG